MRVLFNATAALRGTSGAVHTVGLLRQLSAIAPRHELVLLSTTDQDFLRERLGGAVAHHVADEVRGGALTRSGRLQLALGRIARKVGADVIYNKGNFHAPLAGRQICFVENTNPFSTLRLGEPLWYRTRNRLLRLMSDQALRHADAVIFPTDHARRIITMRSRVRAKPFVIPYGCELPAAQEFARADRPYLLCVSAILPYKNLIIVLDAMKLLRDRRRFDGDLIIAGVSGVSGGGYYRQLVQRRIESLSLESQVTLRPPVPPEQLAALYLGATCLVMPSIEESFGIPVIEAMGLGTPVVASRATSADADRYFIPFEEICGTAAEYFNPFDAETCAEAIGRATEPEQRQRLVDLGRERARHYSWRAAAERTATLLDSIS